MIEGRPDGAFSATSEYKEGYTPAEAAKFSNIGWSPNKANTNEWLQVDLGRIFRVTKVKTKGLGDWPSYYEWVTRYELEYSTNGVSWSTYGELAGNTDKNTAVSHNLSNGGIVAQYLRFIPLASYTWPVMRVEAYGYLSMQLHNLCTVLCHIDSLQKVCRILTSLYCLYDNTNTYTRIQRLSWWWNI